MINSQADVITWCKEQRSQAEKALALFEGGSTRFLSNGVDTTVFQIANIKQIIANLDEIILRGPADT